MYPQRYNRTNFVTSTVAAKICSAMTLALSDGLQHYVENKNGQRWLRVCVKPIEGSDKQFSFEFLAGNGQDVGHLILQAMFNWSAEHEREFSVLLGECYSLTEHPYTVNRQKAVAAEKLKRQQAHTKYLKAQGITHSFRVPSGLTYLGRWKRLWWGGKRFEVLADAAGRVFGKRFLLSREASLYGSIQGAFV